MRFVSLWAVHAAGQEGGRPGGQEDGFLSSEDTDGLCTVSAFPLSLTLRCCAFEFCAAAARRKKISSNHEGEKKTRPGCLRHHFVPQHRLARWHKMVKRTWCDGNSPTLENEEKKFWWFFFFAELLCVYCVNLTGRCFYHHSLRSGFKWLFTFFVQCVCTCDFSLYTGLHLLFRKKKYLTRIIQTEWSLNEESGISKRAVCTHLGAYLSEMFVFRWCAITKWKKHWKKRIVAF